MAPAILRPPHRCAGSRTARGPAAATASTGSPPRLRRSPAQRQLRSPAVIFEAGWGCWSEHWRPVQELAGKFTATYSHDRAGHGSSDPCDPWSLEGCIADLEAWLAAAQVPGPYLLVGHSYR